MQYRSDTDELYEIDSLSQISDGQTSDGNVYKEGNIAIKILHSNNMDLEKAKKFIKLDTKYIILPKGLIYNQAGKYAGYTMKYVETVENGMLHMKTTNFIDNIYGLKKDIEILDDHHILMDDIHKNNTIEGEGIYLIDSDKYYEASLHEQSTTNVDRLSSVVERLIIEKFNIYLRHQPNSAKLMRLIIARLDDILIYPEIFIEREFSSYEYVSDYFEHKSKILSKSSTFSPSPKSN